MKYVIHDIVSNGYWDMYQGLFRGPLYMTKFDTEEEALNELEIIPDYANVVILKVYTGKNKS